MILKPLKISRMLLRICLAAPTKRWWKQKWMIILDTKNPNGLIAMITAITPIFKFSPYVRKVIYTTNAIESLNSTYRKLNRQWSVFPSDTALLKALYPATFEATKNGLWAFGTGDRSTANSALCMRDDSQNNRICTHDEKDVFDVCSWHARNHVVYIKQELEAPI